MKKVPMTESETALPEIKRRKRKLEFIEQIETPHNGETFVVSPLFLYILL